ncbi:MAG: hypothetical protein QNK82_09065 [Akkermansiaceae bacterium]
MSSFCVVTTVQSSRFRQEAMLLLSTEPRFTEDIDLLTGISGVTWEEA